ncbi:glycolipid 2-alpha-mannosyltransferase-domain-containing protein [Mycena olivaceomarginata]|nr:glycolipid 2-alpha-mannosyltransferase-domain-containing protein [Mycena olivaceomarginata]
MTKLIGNATAGVSFGLVPKEHWFQPEWIDEGKARAGRNKMVAQDIIYAGSVPCGFFPVIRSFVFLHYSFPSRIITILFADNPVLSHYPYSYRNMCRFNSGFFFQYPLLQPYRYYWRVEPDVEYFCNMLYDPFHFMQQEDKIYEGERRRLEEGGGLRWEGPIARAGVTTRMELAPRGGWGRPTRRLRGRRRRYESVTPTAKSAALLSELSPRRGRRPFELWPRGGWHVLRPTFPLYEDGAFSIARAAHAYELRPAFLCARRFTISFYEWEWTIPMLWANVKEFIALHPEYVVEDNAMAYLSDDGGRHIICVIVSGLLALFEICMALHLPLPLPLPSYQTNAANTSSPSLPSAKQKLTHTPVWSNFEIVDMSFWRSPAYTAFFAFLESKGGFYYER